MDSLVREAAIDHRPVAIRWIRKPLRGALSGVRRSWDSMVQRPFDFSNCQGICLLANFFEE